MGNREIKSSIELAMEKVAEMSRLTPEELAEQLRKEFAPLGRALALRFMEGRIDGEKLATELGRYTGDPASIVRHALLSELKRSVGLEDTGKNARVFEALEALGTDIASTDLRQRAARIAEEYQKERERTEERFATEYRASLQKRGIAGSALRPNLRDSRGLKARLSEPRKMYGDRLRGLLDETVES
jgi:hypothetical protein